jgi:hypothetical protein
VYDQLAEPEQAHESDQAHVRQADPGQAFEPTEVSDSLAEPEQAHESEQVHDQQVDPGQAFEPTEVSDPLADQQQAHESEQVHDQRGEAEQAHESEQVHDQHGQPEQAHKWDQVNHQQAEPEHSHEWDQVYDQLAAPESVRQADPDENSANGLQGDVAPPPQVDAQGGKGIDRFADLDNPEEESESVRDGERLIAARRIPEEQDEGRKANGEASHRRGSSVLQ